MTQEEKEQFFALYWGQNVGCVNQAHPQVNSPAINMPVEEGFEEYDYLLLKPLSSITDEDAIEVAKMAWDGNIKDIIRKSNRIIVRAYTVNVNQKFIVSIWFDSGNTTVWEWNTERYTRTFNQCQILDFLRSKYAMPFKNYSLEDLIKEGLIKLQHLNDT